MYMDKFLQELCEATNPIWVRDHVTLYADDIHMGCQFIGRTALVQTLQFFGRALDILDRLKLMVSHTKSFMMLAVAGTNTRPALKGVVQRTSTDVQICIPRSDGTKTLLPVRSKGAYLGVVLSYSTFEEHTWHHRKKAGWIAFNRLRPWLKSRQIALTHRLYLWHTCIHTVLTYGLLAVQPTSGILFDYQAIVFRMLRIIIGDHAYLTHHTHRQALAAVGIPEPLTLLHGLTISLQDRLARRMLLLHSTDFLHTVDWSHLTDILGLIHAVQQASAPVPVDPDPWTPIRPQALHSCPHCSFRSQSLANMRRHLTQCHDSIQIRTSEVSFLSVALHGRPQCSNCMRMFASWRNFMVHIERDCCQVSRRMTGPSTKPASAIPHQWFLPGLTIDDFHAANQSFWPVLRRIAQHQTWSDIIQEPDIGEHLKHSCMVYGMWQSRFQELHGHYRLHHPELILGGIAKGAQISHLLPTSSPCPLCTRPYQRVHSCPVALQVGILRIVQDTSESMNIACKCDICQQVFTPLSSLYRHLSQEHGLTLNDWCPSRDAHQDSDACSHCGSTFDSRSGLRRHITEGRCSCFDPMATAQPCATDNKWRPALEHGHVSKPHLSAVQRLHLTTTVWTAIRQAGRLGVTPHSVTWFCMATIPTNPAFLDANRPGWWTAVSAISKLMMSTTPMHARFATAGHAVCSERC